jgi:PEP-CTERM motif-containing protein
MSEKHGCGMHATGSQRSRIFGRAILLAVSLCALPAVQASAIPIQLTSGGIANEKLGPWPPEFIETRIHLEGPGFLLETDPRYDQLLIFREGPPGSTVDLSFGMQIVSLSSPGTQGSLIYGGQQYYGSGFISVTTPSFVVGPTATVPFTLSGSFSAFTLEGGFADFELVGSGTARASFTFVDQPGPPPFWALDDVNYNLAPPPVPEPTTCVLLGAGLVGVAARRRSARRNRC